MATAASTYTWASYEDGLKAYLGLTGDDTEDANLMLWLASANEDCDDLVSHDFTDDDGDAETHPTKILLGIYEWVKAFRKWYLRPGNTGVTSVKTGPLQENYRNAEGVELARRAAFELWQYSVEDVTALGMGYR